MRHLDYLNKLKQQKRIFNDIDSRYHMDKDSWQYQLQQAHNKLYNDYIDKQIEYQEQKAIEEIVMNHLQNMNIDVYLNGEKISDAIVKEITKGFR